MEKPNYYWLYILECENGSYYTGYTKNLAKRYEQHLNGRANAKYTRSFKPKRIAQCWKLYDSIGIVLKVERFIKTQSRKIKTELIQNPYELSKIVVERMKLECKVMPVDPKNIKEEK